MTAQITAAADTENRTMGHAGFNYLLQDMRNEVETLEHLYGDIESEALSIQLNNLHQTMSASTSVMSWMKVINHFQSLQRISTTLD